MGEKHTLLGAFEEIVLRGVAHLGAEGYGVTIRDAVAGALGRRVSFGGVYAALDRLEEKGFVKSWLGAPTPQRGGRAKRHYEITGAGAAALHRCELARRRLGEAHGANA